MFGFLLALSILTFLFWIGFKLTGAVLVAAFWLFVKVPIGLVVLLIGIVLCCTILLIPVGFGCFKTGLRLVIPGL